MTLAELLVSACVTTLAAGAAVAAVMPLQRGFAAQPEAAGLTQRTRVVTEFVSADVRRASLVLPYRFGDVDSDAQRGLFYRRDVITTLFDPVDALARGVVAPTGSRTYYLKQDSEGIWQFMQYDGHASDQPAVEDVVGLRFDYFGDGQPALATVTESGAVRVTYGAAPPPLETDDPADTWGAGENCTIAKVDGSYAPRLQSLGTGLVPIAAGVLTDGPWCPDASHAFRFDADLLRIRRVHVELRLQAARPFRGLSGAWFLNSGTASDAGRYVPDQTVTLEIAPRNLNVAR
jgi:hypothetical protein